MVWVGRAEPYQGGRDPGVEAQQPHVLLHVAVHQQLVLPSDPPHQLLVDYDRETKYGTFWPLAN